MGFCCPMSVPLFPPVTWLYPFLAGTGKPPALQQVTPRSCSDETVHFSSWFSFLPARVHLTAQNHHIQYEHEVTDKINQL